MSDDDAEVEQDEKNLRHHETDRRPEQSREDVENDEERHEDARESKNPDDHRGNEPWD